MAQRLKSWESPRRQGRNSKGKGGSARLRQLKKRQQMLRKKLKGVSPNEHKQNKEKGTEVLFSFYLSLFVFGICLRTQRTDVDDGRSQVSQFSAPD